MDGFLDNLLEKCAGRSASDRLHRRLVEQQLNQIITFSSSESSTGEPEANALQTRPAPAQDQSTSPTAAPEPTKASTFARPRLPPRSKSYIPEPARRPRFRREDRSCVTLDGLLPDEEYTNWYPPESPSSNSNDFINHSIQSSTSSSQNGSDSGLGISGAPLLYSVPKLPEMVGVGRFRRSKTATDEWFQQSLAKELRAMSPLVRDGFFLRGPPIHPFQNRKGSDASATSSAYGQPVVSENGSIIVRGFVSASSSATTSEILEHRTQESSWRSDSGNQSATSPHIGYDCSCPDGNEDDRMRSSRSASSWESATETHQSPMATIPFQPPQKVNLVLKGAHIERLSMADHEEVITEDEGDGNPMDTANEHQTRKVKRAYGSKARVVRRRTSSKGTRKTVKPRTY